MVTGDARFVIGELQAFARVAQSYETKAAGINANLVREKQKLEDAQKLLFATRLRWEELRKEARAQRANARRRGGGQHVKCAERQTEDTQTPCSHSVRYLR